MRSIGAVLFLLLVGVPAGHAASLADLVEEGPAARETRKALECLERGDETENETEKRALYERGKQWAARALQIDEENANAHFAMFGTWGRLVQMDGVLLNVAQVPRVKAHLERALELDPDHPKALSARGGLYLQLPRFLGGNPAKAKPLLERALRLDPESCGTRLELAAYYVWAREPEEAQRLVAEGIRIARAENERHHLRRAEELLKEIEALGSVRAGS